MCCGASGRGARIPPPQDREKLKKWGKALQIEENSPERDEFFDLAAISKGRLPEDVMDDQELAKALPLLFRTVRGNKISDEQFEKLKKTILAGEDYHELLVYSVDYLVNGLRRNG